MFKCKFWPDRGQRSGAPWISTAQFMKIRASSCRSVLHCTKMLNRRTTSLNSAAEYRSGTPQSCSFSAEIDYLLLNRPSINCLICRIQKQSGHFQSQQTALQHSQHVSELYIHLHFKQVIMSWIIYESHFSNRYREIANERTLIAEPKPHSSSRLVMKIWADWL